ncbi:MAG TPA: hypothetical protein PLB01_00205 [Thermoanaerobaculia bacterium]|nr:hypothetical protein [Thermoanaerobaculia bacterium]
MRAHRVTTDFDGESFVIRRRLTCRNCGARAMSREKITLFVISENERAFYAGKDPESFRPTDFDSPEK